MASEEEREAEPELYDCTTCGVLAARRQLSEKNLQALQVYGLLARRVVVDFGLEGLVFDILGLRLTPGEAILLLESLDRIHAARCPVRSVGRLDG